MANNRMWLLHKPTGKAVFLGKRMGDQWYGTPEDVAAMIAILFETSYSDQYIGNDNFCLAMEQCSGAPNAFDGWRYTSMGENPITTLEVSGEKKEAA